MKRPSFFALVTFFVLLAINTVGQSPAANAQDPPSEYPHCVIFISSVPVDSTPSSEVLETVCFDTVADALAYATGNAISLPKTASTKDAVQALRHAEPIQPSAFPIATYVVGTYWQDGSRGGSSYVVVGNQMCGGVHYGIQDISAQWGGAWNDSISSAEGFANCNRVELYEHVNYNNWLYGSGGGVQYCYPYCASLGAMNDRTSSTRLMP